MRDISCQKITEVVWRGFLTPVMTIYQKLKREQSILVEISPEIASPAQSILEQSILVEISSRISNQSWQYIDILQNARFSICF